MTFLSSPSPTLRLWSRKAVPAWVPWDARPSPRQSCCAASVVKSTSENAPQNSKEKENPFAGRGLLRRQNGAEAEVAVSIRDHGCFSGRLYGRGQNQRRPRPGGATELGF